MQKRRHKSLYMKLGNVSQDLFSLLCVCKPPSVSPYFSISTDALRRHLFEGVIKDWAFIFESPSGRCGKFVSVQPLTRMRWAQFTLGTRNYRASTCPICSANSTPRHLWGECLRPICIVSPRVSACLLWTQQLLSKDTHCWILLI